MRLGEQCSTLAILRASANLPSALHWFAKMTSRGAASGVFNQTMFPLAWSVVREYRLGRLADPWPWISATGLPGDIQLLADVVEDYFGHDVGLVSLSNWVVRELPQGRAHFIDTDTDVAWTFVSCGFSARR